MQDEQTNETNTEGEDVNSKLQKTQSQILKEENDSLEKELVRAQKIRNEALLAGTSGGHIEPVVKEETSKEYADKVMSGKFKND